MAKKMQPENPYEFTRAEYDVHVKDNIVHRRLNPLSMYEEYVLIEDLTLYDIYRQPRAPISTTLTLPIKLLNAELQCPICLGWYNVIAIL